MDGTRWAGEEVKRQGERGIGWEKWEINGDLTGGAPGEGKKWCMGWLMTVDGTKGAGKSKGCGSRVYCESEQGKRGDGLTVARGAVEEDGDGTNGVGSSDATAREGWENVGGGRELP